MDSGSSALRAASGTTQRACHPGRSAGIYAGEEPNSGPMDPGSSALRASSGTTPRSVIPGDAKRDPGSTTGQDHTAARWIPDRRRCAPCPGRHRGVSSRATRSETRDPRRGRITRGRMDPGSSALRAASGTTPRYVHPGRREARPGIHDGAGSHGGPMDPGSSALRALSGTTPRSVSSRATRARLTCSDRSGRRRPRAVPR